MEIVIRAATAFIILWLVTRAAGRSTLGELSSFELVLFVVLVFVVTVVRLGGSVAHRPF